MEVRLAIRFMLVSTLAFACMNAMVKQLVHISAFQIVFFRSLGSLIFTFTFLLKNNIPFLGNQRKLLVLRALVGVVSMTFFFMSTKYLPIGAAVSLRYLAPVFAAIFAVFLLHETVKLWQWFFFAMAFIGVLVLKGFDTELRAYGLLLAVGSAVFGGLVFITISKIGERDHPVVVVNYFMVISTIIGGLLSINHWIMPVGMEWVMLFGLGIFGYFGQIYMTKAFQIAATNQVAPLKYLEVIYTVLLGVIIFNEVYSFWSLLGIALIIGGLVLNTLYKAKAT